MNYTGNNVAEHDSASAASPAYNGPDMAECQGGCGAFITEKQAYFAKKDGNNLCYCENCWQEYLEQLKDEIEEA